MTTFGIDLGTTYSCIAYVDKWGQATLIRNSFDDFTTPSVVYFETPENVLVGKEAKGMAKICPELVVSLIKREMGKDLELELHGELHTPETISALILRELARYAAEQTGQSVRDVVITVPAYFGEAEKLATRNAGRIAGLNVLSLVPEPVAAALHYDSLGAGNDRTILVFDLGGGTFDTTVIRLTGDAVTVVCTDGDHNLGGADWDKRIADFLQHDFDRMHPGSGAGASEEFGQELLIVAEDMKKSLSSARYRRYTTGFGGNTSQVSLSRDELESLGAELLDRAMDITERTVLTARQAGIEHFDEVLLVGGAARAPAVDRALRERFGFEPRRFDPDQAVAKGAALFALIESVKIILPDDVQLLDGAGQAGLQTDDQRLAITQPENAAPQRAAPQDAALVNAALEQTVRNQQALNQAGLNQAALERVSNETGLPRHRLIDLATKTVTNVVPRAFGVKVLGNPEDGDPADPGPTFSIAHILETNRPLPAAPETQRFYTAHPQQTTVRIEIWEQAGATMSTSPADNARIGHGLITGLPPLPQGSPIDVTFTMDEKGLLRVGAVEHTTGKQLQIELQIQGLTETQVERSRNTVAGYAVSG
jgi:molecular chaperone DnaK